LIGRELHAILKIEGRRKSTLLPKTQNLVFFSATNCYLSVGLNMIPMYIFLRWIYKKEIKRAEAKEEDVAFLPLDGGVPERS
jgi:hypothetical protein